MVEFEDIKNIQQDSSVKTATLFVSLYLMLLAFFLLLMSISVPTDGNKDAIIGGVNKSFSDNRESTLDDGNTVYSKYHHSGDKIIIQKNLSKLVRVAQESISMIEADITKSDGYAVITIDKNLFFDDGSDEIKLSQLGFIELISARILQLQENIHISMELVVGANAGIVGENELAINQADNLVQKFILLGNNEGNISIGLDFKKVNKLQFKFTSIVP